MQKYLFLLEETSQPRFGGIRADSQLVREEPTKILATIEQYKLYFLNCLVGSERERESQT